MALPPRGPGQPLSDSPLVARQVAPPDLAAQTSPMPLCAPALMSTSSPGMACPGPGPSARRPARTSQRTRKGKGEAGMWPRRVQWVPTDVGVRKCVDGRHCIEWNDSSSPTQAVAFLDGPTHPRPGVPTRDAYNGPHRSARSGRQTTTSNAHRSTPGTPDTTDVCPPSQPAMSGCGPAALALGSPCPLRAVRWLRGAGSVCRPLPRHGAPHARGRSVRGFRTCWHPPDRVPPARERRAQ